GRRFGCWPLDHDGSDDRRHPEEGWPCARRTRRWNGRHGRHGLLRSLCPAPRDSPSSSRPQGTEIGKPRKICGAFFVSSILAPGPASIAALLHAREFEFIAVYSLPHGFASPRIAVHLFLRITEKFELEHPHGQSCADEG